MNPNSTGPGDSGLIENAAAEWVLRLDRGFSAAEQDAYLQWLAADPRHGEAMAMQSWGWEELDRLAGLQTTVHAVPDPDLLAPPRRRQLAKIIWFGTLALASAAAVGLGVFLLRPNPIATAPVTLAATVALAAPIEQRTLEDGSVVELNRGAELAVQYTAQERHVRLLQGEASFRVAKNPARPFIVHAGGVEVRAVGTEFNVRLGSDAVEVVVTEGKVRVDQPAVASPTGTQVAVPLLEAGQRAVVALAPAAPLPHVATLSQVEMEKNLAWQPRLLDFTDAPLRIIVSEFNARNPVRLVIGVATLENLRLSATFRSDNVEGFVRLMESDFGMRAEWREREIVLRPAN